MGPLWVEAQWSSLHLETCVSWLVPRRGWLGRARTEMQRLLFVSHGFPDNQARLLFKDLLIVHWLIVKILEVSDFLNGPFYPFFFLLGILAYCIGMWRKTACGSFVIGAVLKALADMQYRREKTVNCSRPLQKCSTGGRRQLIAQGPCRYAVQAEEDGG